jgi:two-component system cell cycle sensor histidine kinase/response regulator CckA
MNGSGVTGSAFVPSLAPTILVIDDDAAMRMILSMTLKSLGYLVLVAGDGDEAVQVARDHPEIRVILLDVVMPGLSGRELAEQLKVSLPDSAILFCSGHPVSVMSRYDIDLTSDHFLQKPCLPLVLERKIEELLASTAQKHPVRAEST